MNFELHQELTNSYTLKLHNKISKVAKYLGFLSSLLAVSSVFLILDVFINLSPSLFSIYLNMALWIPGLTILSLSMIFNFLRSRKLKFLAKKYSIDVRSLKLLSTSSRTTFEVFKSGVLYYFRLKAGNGEIILSSEGYKTIDGAMNGIKSVKENAKDNSKFEIRVATNGQKYLVLKAKNGKIIGITETFKSSSSLAKSIKLLQKYSKTTRIKNI